MKLTITIDDTTNAALGETPDERDAEVCRIIRGAVRTLECIMLDELSSQTLLDTKGNVVGQIAVTK